MQNKVLCKITPYFPRPQLLRPPASVLLRPYTYAALNIRTNTIYTYSIFARIQKSTKLVQKYQVCIIVFSSMFVTVHFRCRHFDSRWRRAHATCPWIFFFMLLNRKRRGISVNPKIFQLNVILSILYIFFTRTNIIFIFYFVLNARIRNYLGRIITIVYYVYTSI